MKHSAKIFWKKQKQEIFKDGKYSRVHTWFFDGGIELVASSSPEIVSIPMSDASAVDPEEAFLASVSSCHMLFFLSIAAHQDYSIESYTDTVIGTTGQNEKGKMAIRQIILNPKVVFSNLETPSLDQIEKMHYAAHSRCYIANSIQSKISIHPIIK
ncbi:OsmC family protein [Aquimarina muelleri]|uniref:Peroxiredoxin n=1 Tax=Aquimarina muelleri TaxID=279356 RepID=A0A918JU96_9FLAO|nr:OsmC family protein [Aquimarina muelleri]MCX2763610.1 OsmC family protein [Aquimarina muelleri]GGX14759.1 peroxiredoxin [Aquimarina muelleri]